MPDTFHPRCDGGEQGHCPHRAVWRTHLARDPDGWTYACGIHLAWAASELTGGEHGRLALERIVTDER